MAKDRFAPGIYRQEDRLYGSFVLFDLGVWRERERNRWAILGVRVFLQFFAAD